MQIKGKWVCYRVPTSGSIPWSNWLIGVEHQRRLCWSQWRVEHVLLLLSLSAHPSVCLSVCVSIYLSAFLYLSTCLSVSPSIHWPACLSVSPSVCHYTSIHPSIHTWESSWRRASGRRRRWGRWGLTAPWRAGEGGCSHFRMSLATHSQERHHLRHRHTDTLYSSVERELHIEQFHTVNVIVGEIWQLFTKHFIDTLSTV